VKGGADGGDITDMVLGPVGFRSIHVGFRRHASQADSSLDSRQLSRPYVETLRTCGNQTQAI
jgi:hypothetical protein